LLKIIECFNVKLLNTARV